MNVLLVSQCNKRALKETRRILDQFAERRGERTWQTAITLEGLKTLRKLLRQKARKNTAVACHWIRGHDHSELVWVVGDASRFNSEGAVPTNTTQRNILRSGDENDWHNLEIIKSLSQLAGLLHDLGKASVAFQERLDGKRMEKNLYRHEWVSLRLWQAFVGDDDNDEVWLERLANTDNYNEQDWLAKGRYQCDGLDAADRYPFRHLPPLAAAIGWLVVTHHRLPVVPVQDDKGKQKWLGCRTKIDVSSWLDDPLAKLAHDSNEVDAKPTAAEAKPYWQMAAQLPVVDKQWSKAAARTAKRLQELNSKQNANWLGNPYVMHLSRLCLMLSDHYYSGRGFDTNDSPVAERLKYLQQNQMLKANTTYNYNGKRVANQSLLEHLLGVGQGAATTARALPGFERYLPRLANHRGLRKRTIDPRFVWQNRAYDKACAMREQARTQGAFIINMASTGCGKTLANARLLYGLANPQQGMRATYALGLRALTLQTGRSYRKDLHLDEDELAIHVGGSASRALFEYYQEKAESTGSASAQELLEEDCHVLYEGNHADHPLLARALSNPAISKLISAPMLVSTVDHLAPATESLRAGRQIAPMLRLMSSDLILDELDDYGIDDLPALTRLVHWAGLLGSRVVLSSATLPPALVEGMFLAYQTGRKQYSRNRGETGGTEGEVSIPCLWVDEFDTQTAACQARDNFTQAHHGFVTRRVAKLTKAQPLRQAELLPIEEQQPGAVHAAFAKQVQTACLRLHKAHAEADPVSGKHVSFGLVRMANIEPLIEVVRELYRLPVPTDTRIHLCVYHSRFPLVQRSAIENQLDAAFNRREDDGQAVYQLPQIRQLLDTRPESQQLFVVLASPVCEVGRDWDADWAVVEPSSMRSLIQLAGRVQRHRQKQPDSPNLLVFDTCLKYLKTPGADRAFFNRPGFEDQEPFRLKSHWLNDLLETTEYEKVNAIPRVLPRPVSEQQPQHNLVDLEQARLIHAMLPVEQQAGQKHNGEKQRTRSSKKSRQYLNAASGWQSSRSFLTGVLPQQQPFRASNEKTVELIFLPDDDEETLQLCRVENDPGKRGKQLYVGAESQRHEQPLPSVNGVSCWGEHKLMTLLAEQAEEHDMPLDQRAKKYARVEVREDNHGQGWNWHPWLGFANAK